ncbi:polyhydroxyalkanoate synthesis repressor PhaR [Methylocapsa acidiphila]|uniref:polyhydroxyalkanoate synthesis repressor PhaR n=1 Tax=Methylocapsa acidiphila TaxID=133552 RepID=UPI0004167AD2|nr:polyhydroxyalkanoate synthesis repressor PhaR [Methylocapsa acidiphila]
MSSEKQPITVKKYANRRLYNTSTSAYVTLEDLATMVKSGVDFVVFDAKSGEDITRSVLTQIIFEQEGKVGQSLLPITFLRQLIRFYGDSMQMLVPSYLEFTIGKLTSEQSKFRDQVAGGFAAPAGAPLFGSLEEQARKNMALFNQALGLFSPFTAPQAAAEKPCEGPAEPAAKSDIEEMKRQLEELQKRIEGIGSTGSQGTRE